MVVLEGDCVWNYLKDFWVQQHDGRTFIYHHPDYYEEDDPIANTAVETSMDYREWIDPNRLGTLWGRDKGYRKFDVKSITYLDGTTNP